MREPLENALFFVFLKLLTSAFDNISGFDVFEHVVGLLNSEIASLASMHMLKRFFVVYIFF